MCSLCGLFCVQLLPLEEDLRRCRREQQEAQLRGRQLEQRVEELEERNAATVGERERQVKLMEVNVSATWVLQQFGIALLLCWGTWDWRSKTLDPKVPIIQLNSVSH